MATEYVEGCNLREWLHEHGSPGERASARIVLTLARALEAAHEKGIIHCDVKPDNVFGCRGTPPNPEMVKLGDFGLARLVKARDGGTPRGKGLATGGTVGYMAPEQYWGDCDVRSDLYALGGLFLCLIRSTKKGRGHYLDDEQIVALRKLRDSDDDHPTAAQRRERVLESFREAGLLRLTEFVGDPQLRTIITKSLAFDPADRYGTASELVEDLARWLNRKPLRHANYTYRKPERLRMLIDRCRERDDIEDHSQLWGLVCLITGPLAIVFSWLGTALAFAGVDPDLSRNGTGLVYTAIWLIILFPTLWVTRGRRPTSQLFGYMLMFLAAHTTMRFKMGLDHGMADAVQVLIMGVIFGCMGLGSRHWGIFLYLGLALIGLAWPISMAARQPWYGPYGTAVMGTILGLVLTAFGVTYLYSPPSSLYSHQLQVDRR